MSNVPGQSEPEWGHRIGKPGFFWELSVATVQSISTEHNHPLCGPPSHVLLAAPANDRDWRGVNQTCVSRDELMRGCNCHDRLTGWMGLG